MTQWRNGARYRIITIIILKKKHRHSSAAIHWEVIADNLSKAGWSLGYVSAIDSNGRTSWIADAHRGNGKRFVVRTDEQLTAFLELESAIALAAFFA
jgi:hypothetical protein